MQTNGDVPASPHLSPYPFPVEISGKRGERFVACWDAMQGVTDPAALRAALETLRRARLTGGIADVLNATDKIIDLIPAPEPTK